MATTSQEQLLNDIKTQLNQYVYRSSEAPLDAIMSFLQDASGNGNLNWHLSSNNEKLASIFTNLSTAITSYNLNDGDFRTYILSSFVNIVLETYETELYNLYLKKGYNISPESIQGSLSKAYSTSPIQNTNFPDKTNTSNDFNPEPSGVKLVPSTLYINSGIADIAP